MKLFTQVITFLGTALINLSVSALEPADIAFTDGKVYTVNEKQPWAEAVAVKGNKIVYVGDNAGAKAFIGKDTKQTDLVGRCAVELPEGDFQK